MAHQPLGPKLWVKRVNCFPCDMLSSIGDGYAVLERGFMVQWALLRKTCPLRLEFIGLRMPLGVHAGQRPLRKHSPTDERTYGSGGGEAAILVIEVGGSLKVGGVAVPRLQYRDLHGGLT